MYVQFAIANETENWKSMYNVYGILYFLPFLVKIVSVPIVIFYILWQNLSNLLCCLLKNTFINIKVKITWICYFMLL